MGSDCKGTLRHTVNAFRLSQPDIHQASFMISLRSDGDEIILKASRNARRSYKKIF